MADLAEDTSSLYEDVFTKRLLNDSAGKKKPSTVGFWTLLSTLAKGVGRGTAFNVTSASMGTSYITETICTTATWEGEKTVEARRQIDRLRSIATAQYYADNPLTLSSIESTSGLIQAFASGPIPIPIASTGEDGGTTLFFGDDDFYGDLEVNGANVEYYIKYNSKEGEIEVFDNEKIESGYVPPKLLGALYSYYAAKS